MDKAAFLHDLQSYSFFFLDLYILIFFQILFFFHFFSNFILFLNFT